MSGSGGTIMVKAKGDFGFSPKLGQNIVKGQSYTIDEGDFSDQLFRRPKGWIPPAERTVKAAERKKTTEGGN